MILELLHKKLPYVAVANATVPFYLRHDVHHGAGIYASALVIKVISVAVDVHFFRKRRGNDHSSALIDKGCLVVVLIRIIDRFSVNYYLGRAGREHIGRAAVFDRRRAVGVVPNYIRAELFAKFSERQP